MNEVDAHDTTIAGIEVRRTFDPEEVNSILNHESVFPSITLPGLESLDARNILRNRDNVALLFGDDGCILFCYASAATYEIHTNFVRHSRHVGRGRRILDAARLAADYMFLRTDCLMLTTRTPKFNRAARLMLNNLGWNLDFRLDHSGWATDEGAVGASFHSLSYLDWFRRRDFSGDGRLFHELLNREFQRCGVSRRQCPEEHCHDHSVGLAWRMIQCGQPDKALMLYNVWAARSGYTPFVPIRKNPILIDNGDAVIELRDKNLRAILCR